MPKYIGAIDQGTTSSRFILFDRQGNVCASSQIKLPNYFPNPGWQEQNPMEILETVTQCIENVMVDFSPKDIMSIGITNQRETVIVWDRETGEPLHNAVVWCDLRTQDLVHELSEKLGGKDALREQCGLPLSTYFSAMKLKWLKKNVPAVEKAMNEGRAMVGTVDSWLIWKLTGVHVTDVSNASRTMLLNIHSLEWDDSACDLFGVDKTSLPRVASNSEIYGHVNVGSLSGVPISGCIGDQQAALLGQQCLTEGEVKNTYGTGCFLLMNTDKDPIQSKHGLLTTVAFKLGPDEPCKYALEGSVAVAGAALSWLQDSVGLAESPIALTALAASVPDAGGMYFVPAFSGLLSPYWRDDARGVMVGLTRYITKAHICRAAIEASAYQTVDVIQAMQRDSNIPIKSLKVDGGLSRSDLLCRFQSSILGVPVLRPSMDERTALGAAFAAGLADGVKMWEDIDDLLSATNTFASNCPECSPVDSTSSKSFPDVETDEKNIETEVSENKEESDRIEEIVQKYSYNERSNETFTIFDEAHMDQEHRNKLLRGWRKAVEKSIGWFDDELDE